MFYDRAVSSSGSALFSASPRLRLRVAELYDLESDRSEPSDWAALQSGHCAADQPPDSANAARSIGLEFYNEPPRQREYPMSMRSSCSAFFSASPRLCGYPFPRINA